MAEPKTVEDIDKLAQDLQVTKIKMLERRGWVIDASKIITGELWQKEIGGKVYVVELDTALSIELAFDYLSCRCDDDEPSPCPMHPSEAPAP